MLLTGYYCTGIRESCRPDAYVAMAVALLTTLYGAFVANVMFMPMAKKLEGFTEFEVSYRQFVLEGLRGIARSDSPRNIQDQMAATLPPKLQAKFEVAA